MFLNKKFIGFCAIGIINTFNTAFFSWLAHFKIQENISAHIGFFISLTINYILNSLIVFKSRLSLKKIPAFPYFLYTQPNYIYTGFIYNNKPVAARPVLGNRAGYRCGRTDNIRYN